MAILFLILFIAVPIVEIALLIEVGSRIGAFDTILLIVLTAAAGTALLRYQGLSTLARARDLLARGEPPVGPVFDGLFLLAAGVLLLTPGFFTDALGGLLFIPALRRFLGRHILARVLVMPAGGPPANDDPTVIEVDYQDLSEPPETAEKDRPDDQT